MTEFGIALTSKTRFMGQPSSNENGVLRRRDQPEIPLLRIYPKECDLDYSIGTCTPMFIAALFTIAKLWKQPICPTTEEWIKKM
jgi:hypothetical protein